MKYLMVLALVMMAGCGKSNDDAVSPVVSGPSDPVATIEGQWLAQDDGQTVIDFSSAVVGEERPSEEILATCDHDTWGNRVRSYTNSGETAGQELADLTPGAQQGVYKIMGSASSGVIQMGYLKNSQFSNDICRILSSERYAFNVSGDVLTLTLQAPGKSYDGAVMTLSRATSRD